MRASECCSPEIRPEQTIFCSKNAPVQASVPHRGVLCYPGRRLRALLPESILQLGNEALGNRGEYLLFFPDEVHRVFKRRVERAEH